MDNVLVLLKMCLEPILSITEHKDCLDIMNEMETQELLKHPVVVDVINLVYESKYAVNSSALGLSTTVDAFSDSTFDMKSITGRLISNITSCNSESSGKQSSILYHFWKRSIVQRQEDSMNLSLLVNIALIILCIMVNGTQNSIRDVANQYMGGPVIDTTFYQLTIGTSKNIKAFC
jgi:hypothetical protein